MDCGDTYIACENAAYVLKNVNTDEEIERIEIEQDDNGIDTVDRIGLLKKYIMEKGFS